MRVLIVGLFLILLISASASAQDCGIETCTPTPTATPTATPNTSQIFTLPTTTNDLGTPDPEQSAVFIYSADAGQVAIGGLLAVLIVSLWAMFTIWLILRPRPARSNKVSE